MSSSSDIGTSSDGMQTEDEEEGIVTPPSTQQNVQQEERAVYLPARIPARTEVHVVPQVTPCCPCSRLTCVFVASVAAAVLGSSAQFGYNTGVLSGHQHIQNVIIQSFNQSFNHTKFTSFEMNVSESVFALGGLLGALPAGLMADGLGRKHTLLLNNVMVWVGVGLQSLAVHPAMFIAGRFVMGVNSGINTVLVPIYLSELSPVRLRGSAGALHQVAITAALFLSQVLGFRMILGRPDNQFYGWRILFAIPLLFSVMQLAVLPWCPRSPRFLYLKKKDREGALRALKRLRHTLADVREDERAIKSELEWQQQQFRKVKKVQLFTIPHMRQALLVSIVLHLALQLCGIAGVFYYRLEVFRLAGVSNGEIATVAVGVVLVAATFFTVFLVEMLGRRTLILYGLGGMGVFFILLTSTFCFQDGFYHTTSSSSVTAVGVLLVVFSLVLVALFAIGPGTIPWLMVPELFLQQVRPVAVSMATSVNWLANLSISLSLSYILKHLHPYGTSIFVVTCGVLWFILYVYLPETRGRSIHQVTAEFRTRKLSRTILP